MKNMAELKKYLFKGFEGCGDNSCRIKKPTGMSTNGGCRCHYRMKYMSLLVQKIAQLKDKPEPQIKPINEHEWSDSNVVEYVENDENSIRVYFCGDYNYLELSDADMAVLANAKGYKLVKI